ncbi:MAG: hypothetical protein WCR52_12880 [Bacteroidota bacterium]
MLKLSACTRAMDCLHAKATGSNAKTLTTFTGFAILLFVVGLLFLAANRQFIRWRSRNQPLPQYGGML